MEQTIINLSVQRISVMVVPKHRKKVLLEPVLKHSIPTTGYSMGYVGVGNSLNDRQEEGGRQ